MAKSRDTLAKHGRLVVISFHSLEDRIVKQFIRAQQKGPSIPSYLPIPDSERWQPVFKHIGKAIKPSKQEVESNVRSRSAIMRVAEKMQ